MKYLKMLGLAAVAAAALMAFVGAGTASADELCTTNAVSNMCPAGDLITTINASQVGAKGVLETKEGTELISCKAGNYHIVITSQGTSIDPILGTGTELEFKECSGTVNTIANGTVKGSFVGSESGSFTSVGAEVTTGILGTTCTYGSGTGTSLGNTNNTTLTINTLVKKTAGSFLCPSEARWTAEFKITNHSTVVWIDN